MVRILGWTTSSKVDPHASDAYPQPILEDDRERYSPSVVQQVEAWLKSIAPQFDGRKPTAQVVTAAAGLHFTATPQEKVRQDLATVQFESGTVEILLRRKDNKVPLGKYRFLVARNPLDHTVILGPFLLFIPTQQVVLPPVV